jgi:hypothetical protein
MESVTFSNDFDKDILYDKYDQAINVVMVNIYTLTKEKGQIILENIDRNNKDHLLILRVAMIAKDVYNFQLKLKTGFWNWVVLNWRMRKLSRFVRRERESDANVDAKALIEFMTPVLREAIEEDFCFGNIYDAFYKGELG